MKRISSEELVYGILEEPLVITKSLIDFLTIEKDFFPEILTLFVLKYYYSKYNNVLSPFEILKWSKDEQIFFSERLNTLLSHYNKQIADKE